MQQTWQTLVDWVHEHGGFVHPQLALQAIDGNENHRGVFARSDISWNELLIRLSPSLVLSGKHLPGNYVVKDDNDGESIKQVSSWLKCLAAYYQAEQQQQQENESTAPLLPWKPYLDSLPATYETLWQWTREERSEYLAGTSINMMKHDAYDNQDEVIQQRYLTQIRPYLEHVGVVVPLASVVSDSEYERFSKACQAIRTRCFHLVKTQNDAAGVSTGAIADSSSHDDDNDGPTFLPVMDLLNHASSPSDIHTTIRMQADGSLVMVAERDILANTQLLHSYASTRGEMTAAETLSTYGFVSEERIMQACDYNSSSATLPITTTMSSILLSKREILDACRHVFASDVPRRLAAAIKAQNMPDETWEVTLDKERDIADNDDDDYIVVQYDPCNPDTLWSDELVTLTCLPFLPAGAADEVKDSLLDKSVLEDYFLGKLVCATMLRVIHERQTSYTNITYKGGDYDDDFKLLRELQLVSTGSNERSQSQLRLQYALAVRIEEKTTLDALRKEVVKVLANLDDDDGPDGYVGLEDSSVSKRQKM